MPWVKIDDNFYDHPKITAAGLEAAAVFVFGLSFSSRHLTDGFIPDIQARRFAAASNDPTIVLGQVVAAGLWEKVDGGYVIHDYLEYNPSAEQVKTRREAEAKRKAEWREQQERKRQGGTGDGTDGGTDGVTDNVPVPVPVPVPDPVPGEDDNHVNRQSFDPYIRQFLAILGRKRFNSTAQHKAALALLEKYPATFMDAARWTADQGMDLGKALTSMRSALPKWRSGSDKKPAKPKTPKLPKHPPSMQVYDPPPIDPLDATWAPILAELKGQMAKSTFDTQLAGAVLLSIDDPVRIGFRTQMACDAVGLRLNRVMRDTLRRHLKREVDVQYEVLGEAP